VFNDIAARNDPAAAAFAPREQAGYAPRVPDIELGPAREGSAKLRGYLATPSGDGPWPGVVVIHEAFGLNDVVRRQADHLAGAGYLALALDLYSDGGAARCLVATFRALMSGRGKAIADIEAGRTYLRDRPDCSGRVGIIGFCMGGGFALVSANRGFAAASANYGPLPPKLDEKLAGACPVVASYGGRDRSLRGTAAELEAALERLGVEHDVKEYPDAGHSFLSRHPVGPFGPVVLRVTGVGYDQPSAEDAWNRIFGFFRAHLQG
jgi:carboxymethylenebutenolidase